MIVEYLVDTDVLASTIESVPDAFITVEDVSTVGTDQFRVAFWVSGCDLETFHSTLSTDETVESCNLLATIGTQRFYLVKTQMPSVDLEAYDKVLEHDGVPLRISAHGDGWQLKLQFPDRERYRAFTDAIEDLDYFIEERAVFNADIDAPGQYYGLTDLQLETLVAAVELGYFSIPRDASLARLAEHLDISPNAASERLRRAVENLVRNTIFRNHTPVPE